MGDRHRVCLLAAVVAGLGAAGCADAGPFGVDVTLRFDASVTDDALARVRTLSLASSGDEVAVYPVVLDRPAQRTERLVYRPSTGTSALSIEVIAFSIDPATQTSMVLAEGDSGPLQLTIGHTRDVEIVLGAPGDGPPVDMATPPDDLAGDDLAGDDLATVDLSTSDAGVVCPDGVAFGNACLPKPVAHWAFDEGTGFFAADSSGNGNNASLFNGTTWAPGKVGPFAASFDGQSGRAQIGDPTVLDFGTGSFTLAMWVFVPSSVGSYDMAWFKGGSSTSFVGYDFELGTGNWAVNLNDGTTGKQAVFCTETLNTWLRLVAVVDRSAQQLRAYKNGMLVGSTSITGLGSLSSTHLATIGGNQEGTASPFRGLIDDVVIFGTALTPTQVGALN